MGKKFSVAKAIIVVFIASACTMVIELVAGRILAPYIGVSLYTWTSIIGVVLAGISLGNYLGGKIGDRFTSPLLLSIIFFAGAVLSLGILPATMFLKAGLLPVSFHLMSRATIYTFLLFFLPTTVLGMVTPVVIKLTLEDLGKTANVVGTIYAISCVGSIVGTFLTGFLLISWFGTRLIVWQVAGVLFLMALLSSGFWRSKAKLSLIAVTLVAFAAVFLYRDSFQVAYVRESNYYAINIFDTNIEGRSVKALSLDHLIHSYVDLNDPTFHGYGYEQTFAKVAGFVAKDRPDMRVMLIGGGGYSFSRYLEAAYPQAGIEVVEIDPAVTEVAYSGLGLPPTSRIITYNQDARIFLMGRNLHSKYDLIIGDAFNDMSVPYHITTFEFNETVRDALKPDGLYIVNLIDNLKDGQFARSFMNTLGRTFGQVYIFVAGSGWRDSAAGTYVVLATNRALRSGELISLTQADENQNPGTMAMTIGELRQALGGNSGLVLTDDYVPVDSMIAPLFASR